MNDNFRHSLQQLLGGEESLFPGLGIERWTTAGPVLRPGSYKWEERLAITGSSGVLLHSMRSIADVSDEAIGEFSMQLARPELRDLIERIEASQLDALPLYRIEPTDLSVRISVVAGGNHVEKFIGMDDPAALDPVRPLLQHLDQLAQAVRGHPHRSLRLRVDLPASLPTGESEVPVTLAFMNSGPAGYWIAHPGSLPNSDSADHCSLLYGLYTDPVPGVTPLPMQIHAAPLETKELDVRPFLWIAGGSEHVLSFAARVTLPEPGNYIVRAVYSNYAGSDSVSGQRRLRGCVFSNEMRIPVT